MRVADAKSIESVNERKNKHSTHRPSLFPKKKNGLPMPPPTAAGGRPCRLLAGPAAAAAQLALAALCVGALLLKRHRERPRRARRVWAADVSKQAVSAAAAHAAGLTIAVAAATHTHAHSECGFYLIVFTIDTAVGSALALALHALAVRTAAATVAAGKASSTGAIGWIARCGAYGDPLLASLLPQLLEWTLCVLAARAACGGLAAAALPAVARAAAGVDRVLAPLGASGELFFVMLAGPVALNILQALVQDGVLKRRSGRAQPAEEEMGGLLPGGAAVASS